MRQSPSEVAAAQARLQPKQAPIDHAQVLIDRAVAIVMEQVAKKYTSQGWTESIVADVVAAMERGKQYQDERHSKIEVRLTEITKALLIPETFSVRIAQLNRMIEKQQSEIETLKSQVARRLP